MNKVEESEQDALESAISEIAEWANHTKEGRARYPSEFTQFMPGVAVTPGAAELAKRWSARWVLVAIGSYQYLAHDLVIGRPVNRSMHEPEALAALVDRASAIQQTWELVRTKRGADLMFVPTDANTGEDLPGKLVQTFEPIVIQTDVFPVGTRIRFAVDCITTAPGQARSVIMLPAEM